MEASTRVKLACGDTGYLSCDGSRRSLGQSLLVARIVGEVHPSRDGLPRIVTVRGIGRARRTLYLRAIGEPLVALDGPQAGPDSLSTIADLGMWKVLNASSFRGACPTEA